MRNLPKSKTVVSLLLIGLAAIIVGGATMAWFTGQDTVESATFTAGTVLVDAGKPGIVVPDGKSFQNVNPGDCGTVTWNIINTGTKAAQLRVKLTEAWTDGLSTDNVFYRPVKDSKWVMYDDNGTIWLYWTGGEVPGTSSGATEQDRTVKLELVVGFDGALTINDYQGKEYTLGGGESKVEAIQSSNNAPATVWGSAWTTATASGYDFSGLTDAAYFLTGAGQDMPCWKGEGGENPPVGNYPVVATVAVEGGGGVEGDGSYDQGAPVTLTATANPGYKFDGWTGIDGLGATVDGATLSFTMPGNAVTVQANFSLIPQPEKHQLKVQVKSGQGDFGSVEIDGVSGHSAQLAEGTSFTIKATASAKKKEGGQWYGFKFVKWEPSSGSTFTTNPYNGTMPNDHITYTAVFEKYKIWD